MRRFVHSRTYAGIRAITGSLFIVFGLVILVWTFLSVQFQARAIPALAMGLALIGLGAIRIRDYARQRRQGL